jgi:hypothetical protein
VGEGKLAVSAEADQLEKTLDNLTYWLFGLRRDNPRQVIRQQREFAYYRAWIDHLVSTDFECGCGLGEDSEKYYCALWEAMKKVRDADQQLMDHIEKMKAKKERA